ncbi:MAG: ATP-binding protein [Bacteroidales bacterium]|nr:ATP-binding protein [Bacteroidales bacterium]
MKIEGFKAIDYLNLKPSSINIITGRNNTGKTSLLEAINLFSDPSSLKDFKKNFSEIINRNSSQCRIRGSLFEEKKELIIKPPRKDHIFQYFIQGYASLLESYLGTPWYFRGGEKNILEEKESRSNIAEKLKEVLKKHLELETVEKALDDFMVISIDNTNYPFFYPSIKSRGVISGQREVIVNELKEMKLIRDNVEDEERFIGRLFDFPSPLGGQGSFIETPPTRKELTFIKDASLSINDIDKEKYAVRIDNIEDFLKEKNIVEDLKDFNLETLVFEDDKGKYSVPFQFMGGGFKSIIGFLWKLSGAKDINIVLLEEPENHLHPGYIKEVVSFLIRLAKEESIQLFITTHDTDFINELLGEELDKGEKNFLREEFNLLQLKPGGFAEKFDYKEAEKHLKELSIDLRGV